MWIQCGERRQSRHLDSRTCSEHCIWIFMGADSYTQITKYKAMMLYARNSILYSYVVFHYDIFGSSCSSSEKINLVNGSTGLP